MLKNNLQTYEKMRWSKLRVILYLEGVTMRKTDQEKINWWNKTLFEMNKPVKIIRISKTITKRSKGGKPYYKIYVDVRCTNGCEIKNTLVSNL